MLVENIELVTQPTQSSCVHACLSMVTGIPVQIILEQLSEPNPPNEYIPWLVRNNILPTFERNFLFGNLYLVDIASLNYLGTLHMVVVDVRCDKQEDIKVFDPQEGNDKVYLERGSLLEMGNWATCVRLLDCGGSFEVGEYC